MAEIEALLYMAAALDVSPPGRRKRVFKHHRTLTEVIDECPTEKEFVERYRVNRDIFNVLLEEFQASGHSNKTERSQAVEPGIQVLLALRFYANGLPLRDVGDLYGVHKATAGRIVVKVTNFLVSKLNATVRFPDTRQQLIDKAVNFRRMAGLPRIVGCIDGTHIPIKAPAEEEDIYVNRKHFHSLAVQIVCDSKLNILSVDPTWPGSNHDSYILKNSDIFQHFDSGACAPFVLLGDSGYPCKRWLVTPYPKPSTPVQHRFNDAQASTRCCVERCIGVLKSRFRCLGKTGGLLQTTPEQATRVISACVVLHNLCIQAGLPVPENDHEEEEVGAAPAPAHLDTGRSVRDDMARYLQH